MFKSKGIKRNLMILKQMQRNIQIDISTKCFKHLTRTITHIFETFSNFEKFCKSTQNHVINLVKCYKYNFEICLIYSI